MTTTILVVEDARDVRRALWMVLQGEEYWVEEAERAELGLEVVARIP